MTHTCPSPVGFLSADRQQALLEALGKRCASSEQRRARLLSEQAQATESLREQLAAERQRTLDTCRSERRAMLRNWDQADEQLIEHYETETLNLREELNRLAAKFRQSRKEEHAAVFRKVQSRCAAVQSQYEARQPLPEEQKQRDFALLDTALSHVATTIDEVREVTARRLNGLPDVPPVPAEDRESPPASVQEAYDAIEYANRQIRETLRELYSGTASKLVDTFWILPSAAAAFLLIWSVTAVFVAADNLLLAVLIGIGVALLLFLSVLGILQIPLRRQTRAIYPRAEHLAAVSQRAVDQGRSVATAKANRFAADLLKTRDFHLEAAERWKRENLALIDESLAAKEQAMREKLQQRLVAVAETYATRSEQVDGQMRKQADTLATEIRTRLQVADETTDLRLAEQAQQHVADSRRFDAQFMKVIERGLQRIAGQPAEVRARFPNWELPFELADRDTLDFLPVGTLQVSDRVQAAVGSHTHPDRDSADRLSVALHRRLHAGLVIDCPAAFTDRAVKLVQGMLWRALTGVAPGRCKLTLIDPVGRGQHFAGFVALADHDPGLVGHRVWTSPAQIEARLTELTQHNEDILQSCLRDQFETIEEYNEVAGSLAEPYRVIAVAGLPTAFTQESASHLRALIHSARRCGNFLLLVKDPAQPWPPEMPPLEDARLLRLKIDDQGRWSHGQEAFASLPFEPLEPPAPAVRDELVAAVGQAALAAGRIEIPLQKIFPHSLAGRAESSAGLSIPIGSQGAHRTLSLALGEGVRQHVLIAGKTGSGKSTLLHTIITAGAMLYTPDELQFYLLDFKKGVEFKIYAQGPLPHARVIGIESEREFGRSVLQRLDAELQARGERFREAQVQEIGDFRRTTGQTLPRILLVVDEFQELFMRDDRIAADCSMFLDRLVRQGRSFGIHVILSSQSLAGSYSLPRATLGQMAVRVALQSTESDAALILGDDNPAARMISRPGEAIYNDASGLVEGNQPFQVAWLGATDQQQMLRQIVDRDRTSVQALGPPVIFEGNRATRWTPELAEAALQAVPASRDVLRGLLGEAIEIGPPMTLELQHGTGRNVLVVASPELTLSLLCATLPSIAADWLRRHDALPEMVLLDGNRASREEEAIPAEWLSGCELRLQVVKPREAEAELLRLQERVARRLETGDEAEGEHAPLLVVITPLERFREFRQTDSYNFSLDNTAGGTADALQALLRDGPQVGVHTILCCQSAETLTRWLPRSAHHDLELRLLGRMSTADSANLIDTPEASDLTAATMLLYDDADGRLRKFRICDLPVAEEVSQWVQLAKT